MRVEELGVAYLGAAVFALVAVRVLLRWRKSRELQQAHLAWATGLFALSQTVSAVSSTLYDPAKLETAPRWLGVVSSAVTWFAVLAFLLFLSDFIHFPKWVMGLAAASTLVLLVLGAVERPDLRFDPERGFVPIPGVNNLIGYKTYLWIAVGYLALAFGALWISFATYGLRVHGLARFRMLSIAGGFLLIFLVIGLIPLLLISSPGSATTIQSLLRVLRYMVLASAPLLLLGFAPPGWIARRFDVSR